MRLAAETGADLAPPFLKLLKEKEAFKSSLWVHSTIILNICLYCLIGNKSDEKRNKTYY